MSDECLEWEDLGKTQNFDFHMMDDVLTEELLPVRVQTRHIAMVILCQDKKKLCLFVFVFWTEVNRMLEPSVLEDFVRFIFQ